MTRAQSAPKIITALHKFNTDLTENFLGGPRCIKLSWVINLQKGGMLPFIFLLMIYFENFSLEAYVYLALHGSYGLCWLLKHLCFPDTNWEKKITVGGALLAIAFVLGPYCLFPFILISGYFARSPVSVWVLAFSIIATILGVVIMMTADAQKYFTLKHRRGLITTGMFTAIRHPNYLGEMMLYGAFALIVAHPIPWIILTYIWLGLFLVNMLMKEASMSRYDEWNNYKAKTNMLIPIKYFLRTRK